MERKEPTLFNVDASENDTRASAPKVPRDDVSHLKRASGSLPPLKAPAAKSSKHPIIIIVIILIIGFCGFIYTQLAQSQAALMAAENRIQNLEGRLELTGDEATQSVAALHVKLKEADSEIRKLWDTRKVNLDAIGKNDASVSGLKKTLAGLDRSLAGLKKNLGGTQNQLKRLNDTVAGLQVSLGNVSITALANDVASNKVALKAVNSQFSAQKQTATDQLGQAKFQLSRLQNELSVRISNTEEAIDSFDVYRLSTNRELLQIQQRLNSVSSGR